MKKIYANVLYPIYGVEVEMPDDATDEETKEAILIHADYLLEGTGVKPIIQNCTIESLNGNV